MSNSNFHLCKLQINSLLSFGLFYIWLFQVQPCRSPAIPLLLLMGSWRCKAHTSHMFIRNFEGLFFPLMNLFHPVHTLAFCEKKLYFILAILKNNLLFLYKQTWMNGCAELTSVFIPWISCLRSFYPPKKDRRILLHCINVAIS